MRNLLFLVAAAAMLVASAHAVAVTLRGAGSSFPSPVMTAQWNAFKLSNTYTSLYAGSNLTYTAPYKDDADFSLAQLAAKSIQYIGTDIPLAAAQMQPLKAASGNGAVLHVPQVLTGVVIAYNFPGWTTATANYRALNFTADLISKILLRAVTQWNDAQILALNPQFAASGLNLNQPITAVARSDVASTTYEITDYLVRFGTAGVWTPGVANRSVDWPAGVVLQSDGGPLADFVNTNPYSIGYAKKKTAASRANCMLGALKGKYGNYVEPTDAAMQFAANTTASPLPLPAQETWSSLSLGQLTSTPLGYPATHFSYFVVLQYRANEANFPESISAILADFLLFTSYASGQVALPAYYVPLTVGVRDANVAAVTQYLIKPVPTSAAAAAGWASAMMVMLASMLLLMLN